jgi:Mce-associated membrane protein
MTAVTSGSDARPRPYRQLGLLLVVTLVLTGVGVAFELEHRSSVTNQALVNSAATATVTGQVSAALNTVLSYDYTKPAATRAAAEQLLVGDASSQYATLFQALQAKAPGQQLTLVAKVVDAGVLDLHGNTAQLLVFLDQSSTRASDKATSASAAQIVVTAVDQDGHWRISELEPL